MDKTDKKVLFILLITLLSLATNIIYGQILNQYIYIGFWLFIIVLLILLIGFKKEKSIYSKDTLEQIFIYTFIYLIIYYIGGLFTGFLKSLNSFEIINIIKNIVPILLQIILLELIRYIILSKKVKLIDEILLVITFIVFDVLMSINHYDLSSNTDILKVICVIIIPSFSKQILLNYITKIGGFKPTILYSIITELYIYLVPVVPDYGDYMNSIIKFMVPMLFFLRFKKIYSKEKVEVVRHKRVKQTILIGVLVLIVGTNVYLISDMFKYQAVTIGSGSMIPTLNIGDIVILKRTDDINTLKVGDILIHHHEKKVIIHRIIEIYHHGNEYTFQTKGDNNAEKDAWTVKENEVIGEYLFKIPYVGYPSVWLSQVLLK